MTEKINLDIFAGGGGASLAMKRAGFPPHVALNHDPEAIAVHAANNPACRHICQDVLEAKPREVTQGAPVGGSWFSPDCTHHSKAKGGKPLDNKRRCLADVVIDYAHDVGPEVIWLENVEEFAHWGPLNELMRPIKERQGEDFTRWNGAIAGLGYKTGWAELVAADYGSWTTRKRFYYCARRDGRPINTPVPTHAKGSRGGLPRWHSAAEIIDWDQPCPSIFMSREEAEAYYRKTGIRVNRPLAPKTMARIAKGVQRFVFDAAQPFIIPITHGGGLNRVHSIHEPLRTITCAHRGEMALVTPFVTKFQQNSIGTSVDEPLHTVMAGAARHGLVAAFLAQHNNNRGRDPNVGRNLELPLSAVTTTPQQGLVTAHLLNMRDTGRHRSVDEPLFTTTGGGFHLAEVRAFLMKYHWSGGQHQSLFDPIHTIDAKARFGLVVVAGTPYEIVDIGMRMLNLDELARGQGFPHDYDFQPTYRGKRLSKSSANAKIGNSVSPQPAEAWILANPPRSEFERIAA